MANKYHRQGFLGAGLVKKLLTSKGDKADTLLKLVRETRRMNLSDKLKNPKFKMKNPYTGKSKVMDKEILDPEDYICLLYTSPSPRDKRQYRMPSSA